jgi:hypothetical protein
LANFTADRIPQAHFAFASQPYGLIRERFSWFPLPQPVFRERPAVLASASAAEGRSISVPSFRQVSF